MAVNKQIWGSLSLDKGLLMDDPNDRHLLARHAGPATHEGRYAQNNIEVESRISIPIISVKIARGRSLEVKRKLVTFITNAGILNALNAVSQQPMAWPSPHMALLRARSTV